MRRKEQIKKRIQGSISVLLVIILLPMMTFSAIIVDISRINMAKQMMSSAGDLTMNTALANYDTILKDVYGLFAMSQIDGMDNEKLGTELNKYFAKTLSSYGVVAEEDAEDYVATLIGDFRELLNNGKIDTNNFLKLKNIKLTAEKVTGSSLANADVMRKQIVEYMKYRAPAELGLSFLDSLTSFQKMDAQNKVVEAQVKAQESTQDVTQACRTLIQLIRAYDKRVVEINGALAGVTGSEDPAVILLEDYDTHVLKYLSSWSENYTHINKLALVFLANTPSVDGVYLKSLNYIISEHYIKSDGTIYNGSVDTGIQVTINPANNTTDAKKQIDQQITNLNDNYYRYVDKYKELMLRPDLLTSNANNISKSTISKEKEDEVINCFIKFEKFLRDQSESDAITYSEVTDILDQITMLDKYRANYENLMNNEIAAAERAKQAAQRTLNTLISNRDNAANAMKSCVTSINNRLNTFFDGRSNELGEVMDQLPACTGDYEQYYNTNIKSVAGTSDQYIDYFKYLLSNPLLAISGGADQRKVISEAKLYVSQKGYDANDFESYMKGKLTDKQEGEMVFKLLCCLKDCHAQALKYKEKLSSYNTAVDKIPDAQSDLSIKTQKVIDLTNAKTRTINSVKACIQSYHTLCVVYQADVYYYNQYINAAKNTVAPEALKIKTHFAQLIAYVEELRADLNEIDVQIGNVKTAITKYNTNLTNWNTANTNYANSNGSDSFSTQTADDIKKAKTEYDAALYDTLDTFVIAMWNEFDELYSKLMQSGNFTYGSKRIDQIATAEDLQNAISGTSFSDVVTVGEATQKLATLYKAESLDYNPYTMDYTNPKQLAFLSPQILQIQALKYLNNAYPEEIVLTCGGCKECDACKAKEANETQKSEYETAKDKLTGDNTEIDDDGQNNDNDEDVDANVTSDFGYTYEALSLKGNLPSKNADLDKQTYTESKYKLSTTGEGDNKRLDASTSVGGQTKTSGNYLSKLGDIATTAVENLYILNYVFENFSYSTIVQEQIHKDIPLTTTSLLGQLTEAQTNFNSADNVANAKKNIKTLSNYAINEKNNYLYGGEIEYIMFGNEKPSANVTSMRASIYAIRFGFNCIFAFTNSEIRNTTMAAGLAVQAATLGIVPYQVVQIVLQLALAAAESAIDLSAMNHGLSVAVVKTKDTWSLSMSGASNVLKDAGNAAAQMLTDKITDCTTKAITSVTNGLNDLLDAGADELEGAITDVANSLETSAQGLLESVADDILSAIMTEIEKGLNGLQYINNGKEGDLDKEVTKEDVKREAQAIFTTLRGKLDAIVTDACGGNAMALGVADTFKRYANQMIVDVETEVLNKIEEVQDVDITVFIAGALNDLKLMVIEKGNRFITLIMSQIDSVAREAVKSTKESIQSYVSQCGEELTEEAAKKIKEEIGGLTDSFLESTLKISKPSASTEVKTSPVALFKFGYKDYLMLLTYISICCSDSVLSRTSDVIQMNLQHAGTSADYQHKANADGGSFLMSKAYTYLSVSATAELDMFFMKFDIFSDQVANEETEVSTDLTEEIQTEEENSGTQIVYKGLLGY